MGCFFPSSKFTAAQTDAGTRAIPAGKWQCYESTRDVIVATRLPAPPSLLFPQLALIRRSAFTVQLHCVHLRLIAFCCARTGCTLKRFPFSSENERERERDRLRWITAEKKLGRCLRRSSRCCRWVFFVCARVRSSVVTQQ